MSDYFDALCGAMKLVAYRCPRAIFMGQAVACPGTGMSRTLAGIPKSQLLELPVAEDMQLGMSIGMALAGEMPVSIFPRWNFLLLATNQLVNHLDKLPIYSVGGYRPKVIIRTAVGSAEPMDPGPQHLGDFTDAFRSMLRTVTVVRLDTPEAVLSEYRAAAEREGSTILVERMEMY